LGGKVVDVAGDPASPNSRGFICAKGKARSLDLHHPKRVLRPLVRTNPEKGIGVDPRWKQVSWDEALELVTARLNKVRQTDPRGLILSHFDIPGYRISSAFAMAFGTPNFHWNRADFCGSASHPAWLMTNGTLNAEMDFERCRYIVLWGTQLGHLVNTLPLVSGPHLAGARRDGTKLVVVDPFCSNAAAKADEWVPLRPGTDGALALGMLNVMLNELGIYDAAFLKSQTNAPYLLRDDGRYLRDEVTRKPLVWDDTAQAAVAFDSAVGDLKIEGSVTLGGKSYRPAFQALKEHVRQFDVERMAEITTVSSKTIRRITAEFCKAASIGASVQVDGHTLPLRPAAIDFKKGAAAHRGGLNSCIAIHLLNLMVGSCDVPGGQRGVNPRGPYWEPGCSDDGLLIPSDMVTKYNKPYPGIAARVPNTLDLRELFPVALFTRGLFPWGIDEPARFGIDYEPAALIHGRTNLMMNSHDPQAMAATLRRIPFQVSICLLIDETAEFADVVLPDAHDFERWDLFPANDPYAFVSPGPGDWYWLARQAVVPAPEGVRPWTETYLELAARLGFLEHLNQVGNDLWNLNADNKVDTKQRYSVRQIAERQARTIVDPTFSWAKLRETSAMITRPKTVQEAYPRVFLPSRIPIYFEHFIQAAQDVKQVTERLKLDWDFTPYTPMPIYIPCAPHEHEQGYELFATNHKLPFHTFSVSGENQWIHEISASNPYTHRIMLHTSVAERLGIRSDDSIVVESPHGSVRGIARVTELIHPDCVAIPGTLGHWAKQMPICRDKGSFYNALVPPLSLERIDTLSGQIDMCVRVRVRKEQPS
jgi:molybdopterin-containing oxidoreductase family molybdopterin binding subunit